MKTRTPRLRRPLPSPVGEEIEDGFQIRTPALPAIDRPGPGDEYRENEFGKPLKPGELASGIRLTAEKIAEMNANAAEWEKDPVAFARFITRQAAIAVQIGAEVMVGTFVGPSANQQRLAASQFVVKEGKEILNAVLKMKGLNGEEGK